MVIHSRS